MANFKRLVRYAKDGQTFYCDLLEEENGCYIVKRLQDSLFSLEQTDEVVKVDKVSNFGV